MRALTMEFYRRIIANGGAVSSRATRHVIREKDERLDRMGWVAVHIWEYEDRVQAANVIDQLWKARRQPPPRRAGMTPQPRNV
jgi:hypothetical protein